MSAVGGRGAGEGIEVGPLSMADLPEVAALHRRAFPDSELGRLGPEALRRYYAWLLDGPHDVVALGARRSGSLVGFVFGGVFRGSTIGFLRTQRWFLIGQALRRPTIFVRTSGRRSVRLAARLQSRLLRGSEPERPWRVPDGSFGVLVVAVDPVARRGGVGSALLAAADVAATNAGFEAMHLTLDPANAEASAFYAALGWLPLGLPGDTEHQLLIGRSLLRPPGDGPLG